MPGARVDRRLAAIMATDIVAYSRLIEADERVHSPQSEPLRSQIIDPLVADHRGRIVKLVGDGAIVEFGSVVDAVTCAVAVQEGVSTHQREAPPESRIVLRIGISLGDVVVDGGDLLGEGVNVASRLEALSEPGGICISEAVQKQLIGKTDLAFEDIGERSLKNITQPMRVWRWTKEPARRWAVRRCPCPTSPPSRYFPSTISAVSRRRPISAMASPKTSSQVLPASARSSSSPATPHSPFEAKQSTWPKLAVDLVSVIFSKAA